jgi:hypothetical protein
MLRQHPNFIQPLGLIHFTDLAALIEIRHFNTKSCVIQVNYYIYVRVFHTTSMFSYLFFCCFDYYRVLLRRISGCYRVKSFKKFVFFYFKSPDNYIKSLNL